MLADDDEDAGATATTKTQGSQQPAWMRSLLERCKEWLDLLPQKFNMLPPQPAEHQDPLYRLFAREGSIGRKLLDQVRKDLVDVVKVCQGELKQTNHLRTLISSLTKGVYPSC
jgi:dynein heavy chain 1